MEFEFKFIRSGGPGGQNVNKVSTAVQLRFHVDTGATLKPHIKRRLKTLAGQKLTTDGWIVITANRFRSQDQNKQDAINRLNDLIQRASTIPKPRKKTKPSKAAKKRRVDNKKKRGQLKALRRKNPGQYD